MPAHRVASPLGLRTVRTTLPHAICECLSASLFLGCSDVLPRQPITARAVIYAPEHCCRYTDIIAMQLVQPQLADYGRVSG